MWTAGVRALLLAFRFLTILPVPVPGLRRDDAQRAPDARGEGKVIRMRAAQRPNGAAPTLADLRRSALFFPLVGAVLGLGAWAVVRGLAEGLAVDPMAAAVAAVSVYTIATGALHVDGWMDVADGVASRRRGADAIAVMKDSRVGAIGAVAGMLLLIGKVAAFTALAGEGAGWAAFVLVPALGRMGMVWAMAMAGPAGSGGLGAVFARRVPLWAVGGATALTLVLTPVGERWGGIGPGMAAVLWCLPLVIVPAYTTWAERRFGGMTGDLYGALNELLEWLGWLWVTHG
ncbi:adenosylcobinamide-GDP ribazoletransferase [Alicyclobacillus sp.]|uniref:adenosylcobinamide-GDP ribazoletransferase n=1 Tax=Alicyclobacillus sp. TaxID=61169 RepID=UPI0025BEBCA2|nr:adenosylcobinamide-GDP ribazoletransferase [Alicyclobacillus sp.]